MTIEFREAGETTQMKQQAQLKDDKKKTPQQLEAIWNEAHRAHYKAKRAHTRAKDAVGDVEAKLRGAKLNGPLTGDARETLAKLADDLVDRMVKEEAAAGAVKRAAKELKVAKAAFDPIIDLEAWDAHNGTARVARLVAKAKEVTQGGPGGPVSPDPTFPTMGTTFKNSKGAAAYYNDARKQKREAAKERGIDLAAEEPASFPVKAAERIFKRKAKK